MDNAAVRFKTGLQFGRLCTEEIHIRRVNIRHVLQRLRVSSVFGEWSVRELPGVRMKTWRAAISSPPPQQEAVQQCKRNVTSYMTEPAKIHH